MGLSERKFKQKINADPRNLTWADNAAKFGQVYLAKHGWTPNTGLGVAGDGRTTHISVAQKLNMLGIGANRPDGPDAIAWKQAKEFEGLLERLNTAGSGEATPIEVEEIVEEETAEGGDDREDKARRKEKRREEKRKAKAAKAAAQDEVEPAPSTPTPAEEPAPVAAPAPRRLAHRARFLAAKRMAGTSSTALSEILGIASTPASTSGPSTPVTPATPTPTLTAIPVLDDSNQITTSTQSVADYFKSKMRERAQAAITSTPVVTFEEPEVDVAPRTGLGARRSDPEEEETRPTGLGFSSGSGLGFAPATGLGFTRATSSPAETESESHTPSSTLSESADSKADKKRKRKEVPAAEPETEAVQDNEATETEAQCKAAKRARKEAKRAAREASGDQPLKKKKRKDKAGEAL